MSTAHVLAAIISMAGTAGAFGQSSPPATPAPQPDIAEVHRLVEAGTSQAAEAKARALVDSDTKDPIAWAVVASANADRGQVIDALSQAARAGELNDRDPFVQRVSGDIIGRVDGARLVIPDRTKAQINTLRHNMKGEAPFDEAYRAARTSTEAAIAAAQPSAPAAVEPMVAEILPVPIDDNPTTIVVDIPQQPEVQFVGAPIVVPQPVVIAPRRRFLADGNIPSGRFFFEMTPGGRRLPPRLATGSPIFINTGSGIHITQRATITRPLPVPPARNESPFDRQHSGTDDDQHRRHRR